MIRLGVNRISMVHRMPKDKRESRLGVYVALVIAVVAIALVGHLLTH